MADFGNFQLETPQEVMQRIQSQLQAGLQSDDVRVRTQARSAALLQGLLGNPEMERAERQTQAVLNAASRERDQADLARRRGGEVSTLDEEISILRAQRDALLSTGNAEAATQATKALTQLGIAREEQRLLQARDERAERVTAAQAEAVELSNERRKNEGSFLFHQGPSGDWEALNVDVEADRNRIDAIQEEGGFLLTQPQVFQLQRDQQLAATRASNEKLGGKKLVENTLKKVDGVRELVFSANQIADILQDDPAALTAASRGAGKLENVLFQARDAARLLQGRARGADGVNNLIWSDQFLEQEFQRRGITNARTRGLITGVAFSLARARDPGGRLSDQDFDRALEMIGGAGQSNPEVLLKVLNDQIEQNLQPLLMSIEASRPAMGDVFDVGVGQLQGLHSEFKTKSKTASEAFRTFQGLPSDVSQAPPTSFKPDRDLEGRTIRILGVD